MSAITVHSQEVTIPVLPLTPEHFPDWLATAPTHWQRRIQERNFSAKPGQWLDLIGEDGGCEHIVVGWDGHKALWLLAKAAVEIPAGQYRLIAPEFPPRMREQVHLGWKLAQYRFSRYREDKRNLPTLLDPQGADLRRVRVWNDAQALVRDWINTPPIDLMPEEMAQRVEVLGREEGARVRVIRDQELIRMHYPCIHAVGSASHHPPRVIELQWGNESAPHVMLVGKGVCFDSGGLDIKPPKGMRIMKKDMGGAAIALGVALGIMRLALPVRLTLLLGAVENAVGSRAFRPGDVVQARNGKQIEIDNTDAEGRLVLADLLVRAGEIDPQPALLIDIATLTGAARVAVGTEVTAVFSNSDAAYAELAATAQEWDDPVWRMPLHEPYLYLLDSEIADIANSNPGGYAGAITAALFLQQFVVPRVDWLHLDLMAWNVRSRPGRPKGGEAMALRALLGMLQARYA